MPPSPFEHIFCHFSDGMCCRLPHVCQIRRDWSMEIFEEGLSADGHHYHCSWPSLRVEQPAELRGACPTPRQRSTSCTATASLGGPK